MLPLFRLVVPLIFGSIGVNAAISRAEVDSMGHTTYTTSVVADAGRVSRAEVNSTGHTTSIANARAPIKYFCCSLTKQVVALIKELANTGEYKVIVNANTYNVPGLQRGGGINPDVAVKQWLLKTFNGPDDEDLYDEKNMGLVTFVNLPIYGEKSTLMEQRMNDAASNLFFSLVNLPLKDGVEKRIGEGDAKLVKMQGGMQEPELAKYYFDEKKADGSDASWLHPPPTNKDYSEKYAIFARQFGVYEYSEKLRMSGESADMMILSEIVGDKIANVQQNKMKGEGSKWSSMTDPQKHELEAKFFIDAMKEQKAKASYKPKFADLKRIVDEHFIPVMKTALEAGGGTTKENSRVIKFNEPRKANRALAELLNKFGQDFNLKSFDRQHVGRQVYGEKYNALGFEQPKLLQPFNDFIEWISKLSNVPGGVKNDLFGLLSVFAALPRFLRRTRYLPGLEKYEDHSFLLEPQQASQVADAVLGMHTWQQYWDVLDDNSVTVYHDSEMDDLSTIMFLQTGGKLDKAVLRVSNTMIQATDAYGGRERVTALFKGWLGEKHQEADEEVLGEDKDNGDKVQLAWAGLMSAASIDSTTVKDMPAEEIEALPIGETLTKFCLDQSQGS